MLLWLVCWFGKIVMWLLLINKLQELFFFLIVGIFIIKCTLPKYEMHHLTPIVQFVMIRTCLKLFSSFHYQHVKCPLIYHIVQQVCFSHNHKNTLGYLFPLWAFLSWKNSHVSLLLFSCEWKAVKVN